VTSHVVARVYRDGWASWWAEVWRPRDQNDPPLPPRRLIRDDEPLPPEGHVRVATALCGTRRGAVRKAKRMRERYLAGLHPTKDRPTAEIVA
jgi:hypothetical protein